MTFEVRQPFRQCGKVLSLELILRETSVHLQRTDRRYQHNDVWLEAGFAADDVHELFGTEVGAKTGLGHNVVAHLERGPGRDDRIGAVRDIGEGASMNEGRRVLDRLNDVWANRVLEEHRHCAVDLEITHDDIGTCTRLADDDVSQASL